jgi:hypothetical protein
VEVILATADVGTMIGTLARIVDESLATAGGELSVQLLAPHPPAYLDPATSVAEPCSIPAAFLASLELPPCLLPMAAHLRRLLF